MQVFDPMTTGSALMIQTDSPIQVSFPISSFQGQSILTSCFMSVPVPIWAPNQRSTSTFVFLVVGDRTADHPKPVI
jgi:hypothetical protein